MVPHPRVVAGFIPSLVQVLQHDDAELIRIDLNEIKRELASATLSYYTLNGILRRLNRIRQHSDLLVEGAESLQLKAEIKDVSRRVTQSHQQFISLSRTSFSDRPEQAIEQKQNPVARLYQKIAQAFHADSSSAVELYSRSSSAADKNIGDLPPELCYLIMDFLSLQVLMQLQKVNRSFNTLVKQHHLQGSVIFIPSLKLMVDFRSIQRPITKDFLNQSLLSARKKRKPVEEEINEDIKFAEIPRIFAS